MKTMIEEEKKAHIQAEERQAEQFKALMEIMKELKK